CCQCLLFKATALSVIFTLSLHDALPISELGWIAGCGVLLCAFACFTVLPSLLTLLDKRSFSESGAPVPLRGPLSHWFLKTALGRSEEHTSELQSLTNIVCRLLLEKKNTR